MLTSPKNQLRLAAGRQDDFRRAADLERRSGRPADDVTDRTSHARLRLGRKPVIGRLMSLVSRRVSLVSRW
jgi:hypothetical protein